MFCSFLSALPCFVWLVRLFFVHFLRGFFFGRVKYQYMR